MSTQNKLAQLSKFGRSTASDLALSALIVAVIALIILPVPVQVLDVLLAINLSLSVLLLMAAIFSARALDLSTFPSLLLFTTLLRLSLNIASTKAILLHADAGHVIETFGQLVMGGNVLVGIVVFAIISIVQFIVITKGSERVAEVGARFTLDAMPGKQMAIDADLRAGHLTPDQARSKRLMLGMETQFHGGMDGAMKFVKGDAIASLLITVVNMVAGIAVGVLYHGMTGGEAAGRFALLSIGDAMVSSIASLFISVSAGVLITRVEQAGDADRHSLGRVVVDQLTRRPSALTGAAVLVAALALIPGFPALIFLGLAGLLAWAATSSQKQRQPPGKRTVHEGLEACRREGAKGDLAPISTTPPTWTGGVTVRLSEELSGWLDYRQLNEAFSALRGRMQSTLGAPFPGVHVWVDLSQVGSLVEVSIADVPKCSISIPSRHAWLEDETSSLMSQAVEADEVLGHKPSHWIPNELGTSIPDCHSVEVVLVRVVEDLLRQHAHQFIGIQEAMNILERASQDFPGLVAEVQKLLPVQKIAEVLRRLLEEQISIRNLRSIFEALVVWGPREKDILLLTEHVRAELGNQIAYKSALGNKHLRVVLMDAAAERLIRQNIKPTPTGNYLTLATEHADMLRAQFKSILDQQSRPAALVTSMDIRRYTRKLFETNWPDIPVLSYQELEGHVNLEPIGQVTGEVII